MSKNKLYRFAEMETFQHVIQPNIQQALQKTFPLRGKWAKDFFKNDKPIVLELGCGKGEYTVGLARLFPDVNFIGIDIKGARMWRGAKTAANEGLQNVAFLRTHIELVAHFFAENEVSEIWLTFPDPQIKKERKRLSSSLFLRAYAKFLKPNAPIHLKTDSQMLHHYTLALVEENGLELAAATADLYQSDMLTEVLSIQTFYEKQATAQGKTITYCKFYLSDNQQITTPKNFDEAAWREREPRLKLITLTPSGNE